MLSNKTAECRLLLNEGRANLNLNLEQLYKASKTYLRLVDFAGESLLLCSPVSVIFNRTVSFRDEVMFKSVLAAVPYMSLNKGR